VSATDAERLAAGARFVKARLIEAGLATVPYLLNGFVLPSGDVGYATNVYASAADIDAQLASEREAALGDTTAPYGTVVVDDPDARQEKG
jgi:hypothetical protein